MSQNLSNELESQLVEQRRTEVRLSVQREISEYQSRNTVSLRGGGKPSKPIDDDEPRMNWWAYWMTGGVSRRAPTVENARRTLERDRVRRMRNEEQNPRAGGPLNMIARSIANNIRRHGRREAEDTGEASIPRGTASQQERTRDVQGRGNSGEREVPSQLPDNQWEGPRPRPSRTPRHTEPEPDVPRADPQAKNSNSESNAQPAQEPEVESESAPPPEHTANDEPVNVPDIPPPNPQPESAVPVPEPPPEFAPEAGEQG